MPEIKEKVRPATVRKVVEPPMYRVLLHNDDYTTMQFVVNILVAVFGKPFEQAFTIMLNVHRQGVGECGIYTYEVAETKVETVHKLAVESGFPLKSSMEKV
ncbi:MAG: ATP-dependent Clp protease adaptor ClpS [Deltaproteobacteria bacterium]|nr:ATP-dependent Clp protease adaptor ClpS [Deltaproteobacteria bacterium]